MKPFTKRSSRRQETKNRLEIKQTSNFIPKSLRTIKKAKPQRKKSRRHSISSTRGTVTIGSLASKRIPNKLPNPETQALQGIPKPLGDSFLSHYSDEEQNRTKSKQIKRLRGDQGLKKPREVKDENPEALRSPWQYHTYFVLGLLYNVSIGPVYLLPNLIYWEMVRGEVLGPLRAGRITVSTYFVSLAFSLFYGGLVMGSLLMRLLRRRNLFFVKRSAVMMFLASLLAFGLSKQPVVMILSRIVLGMSVRMIRTSSQLIDKELMFSRHIWLYQDLKPLFETLGAVIGVGMILLSHNMDPEASIPWPIISISPGLLAGVVSILEIIFVRKLNTFSYLLSRKGYEETVKLQRRVYSTKTAKFLSKFFGTIEHKRKNSKNTVLKTVKMFGVEVKHTIKICFLAIMSLSGLLMTFSFILCLPEFYQLSGEPEEQEGSKTPLMRLQFYLIVALICKLFIQAFILFKGFQKHSRKLLISGGLLAILGFLAQGMGSIVSRSGPYMVGIGLAGLGVACSEIGFKTYHKYYLPRSLSGLPAGLLETLWGLVLGGFSFAYLSLGQEYWKWVMFVLGAVSSLSLLLVFACVKEFKGMSRLEVYAHLRSLEVKKKAQKEKQVN